MNGDPQPMTPAEDPEPLTALVTGATSGIGAATATALARHGARVILLGRDRARCEATVARIAGDTGNGQVEYVLADLSTQRDVRRAAEDVQRRCGALHVLVNNAGGLFMRRRESPDGIELTLAVNHLAPFLLTELLLDLLKRSAPARIVNVASAGHVLAGGIRRADLQWRTGIYRGFQAYHQSKLASILFTYELARRLRGTGVAVNAVDPGMVATNIGGDNPWYWKLMKPALDRVMGFRYVTPEEGARTVVHLAWSTEVDGVSGAYFKNLAQGTSSDASRDEETARWLWQESERLTREPGR